jgi:hypothetical protein
MTSPYTINLKIETHFQYQEADRLARRWLAGWEEWAASHGTTSAS